MGLKIGQTTIAALKLGTVGIAAAYLGTLLLTGAPPPDSTPNPFSFNSQTNAARNVQLMSNSITPIGYAVATSISVANGQYEKNGNGTWLTAPGTLNPGDTVKVRHTSSAAFSTSITTSLTIGGVVGYFISTTLDEDTVPNAFGFTDQTNVAKNTLTMSNSVTPAGYDSAPVTITGGEYEINADGNWRTTAGTIVSGQSIRVRHTSANGFSLVINTVLTIGGVSDTFTTTTVAQDTTPNQFSFSDVSDVAVNTVQVSNSITPVGYNSTAAISITGGEYEINGNGVWKTAAGTIDPGQSVKVRHTSSNGNSTSVNTTLTIDTISDTFTSTTIAVASGTLEKPVLAVEGAAGSNPMSWQATYPGATVYAGTTGTKIRMRFRINSGAWTTEADQPLDGTVIAAGGFLWPLFMATTFPAGALVEVQEQQAYFTAGAETSTSLWSDIISDTMAGTSSSAADATFSNAAGDINSEISLSTDKLTATKGVTDEGAVGWVSANVAGVAQSYFEISVDAYAAAGVSKIGIGVTDASVSLTAFPNIGLGSVGCSCIISKGGTSATIFANNDGNSYAITGGALVAGSDRLGCDFDVSLTTNTITQVRFWVIRANGTRTQIGPTQSLTTTQRPGTTTTVAIGGGQAVGDKFTLYADDENAPFLGSLPASRASYA